MIWSDFIQQKNLAGACWVLQVKSSPSHKYFSTLPTFMADALLEITSMPSQKVPHVGGGASVGTLTAKILDIPGSDGVGKATKFWGYRDGSGNTHAGKPVALYFGDRTETLANLLCIWQGYVREAQYKDGCWEITCEDALSKAKNATLAVDESWFAVASNGLSPLFEGYKPKDPYMLIKKRKRMPAISTPTNLLTNGNFDDNVTGWTYSGGGACTLTHDNTKGYLVADGCAEIQSTGGTTIAAIVHQDVTLTNVRPGDVYGAMVYAQRSSSSSPDDTKYQLRVCLKLKDQSGNLKDVAWGTARKVEPGSGVSDWSLHSCSAMVSGYQEVYTARVEIHVLTGATYPVRIDAVRLYKMTQFCSVKREVYGMVGLDETSSPNRLTVVHSVLGTRENSQPKDKKGKVVKVIGGFAPLVALRLLTTTATGGNGTFDAGDGFGCGIPSAMVDQASFTNLAILYPDLRACWVIGEDIADPLDWINKEILEPCGAWLIVSNNGGLVTFRMMSAPSSADWYITDSDNATSKRPSLTCSPEDRVTRLQWLCDFDFAGNTVESSRDQDPWAKRPKALSKREAGDGDPQYIGRWEFTEYDYRVDGVHMDQALANEARYGKKVLTVKSKGARSFTSAASGMPCPMYYWGASLADEYAWRGEAFGRSLAERVLHHFSSPVYRIGFSGFARFMSATAGDAVSFTSSYVPNLGTSPTFGVSNVLARIAEKKIDPKGCTVQLVIVIMDGSWSWPPVVNRPAIGSVTNPDAAGATNVVLELVAAADLNSSNFDWIPRGNVSVMRLQHKYGGTLNQIPTFTGYAYTEVRVRWTADGTWHKVLRTNSSKALVVLPGISPDAENNALHQVSFRVYWRDVAGTYYGSSPSNEITLGNANTPGGSGWVDIENPDTLE